MRKVWIAGAVVLVGLLGVWLILRDGTQPERSDATSQEPLTAGPRRERAHGVPTPPPSGDLRIRGTVRDEHGPVAGVQVSATRPMPGETLSELPCPASASDGNAAGLRDKRFPDCLEEASAQLLELVGAREGEAPVYAQTVTAADGSFVLDGLPEGDFTLWALGERGAELRSGVQAGAQDVALVLNEGVTLTGIVLDENDQPLPGVALTILHEQHTRFFDTRSGGDGRFRIGPLPKGKYGLVAESEGWLPEFLSHEDLEMLRGKVFLFHPSHLVGRVLLEGGAPAPGAKVSVKAQDCQHFTEQVLKADAQGRFALERLGPCNYEFTAERDGQYAYVQLELNPLQKPPAEVVLNLGQAFFVEGTVRDDTQRPLEGATVSAHLDGEYRRYWKATTDAEGHYRLGPVAAGSYGFEVSAPGYVDARGESRQLARAQGPVDWTLDRAVSISGVLVDEEGQPIPHLPLLLLRIGEPPEGTPPPEDTGNEEDPSEPATFFTDSTSSDEAGRFVLDAPRPGSYKIEAEDEGFTSLSLPVHAPTEGLRIVLHRGATVVGTVTDERGAPQENAAVTLWHAEQTKSMVRSTRTDAQGHFALRGLPAGRFVVEAGVECDGPERTDSKPVELRSSEQLEVALRFAEGRSLSGIVVDGSGQPLEDVLLRLELHDEATPSWRRGVATSSCGGARGRGVSSGPDGRFTLKHLVASTYELSVRKEGYTFVPARAQGGELVGDGSLLVREGTSEVRVVLERQSRVRGRLVGPDGAPLRYFEVDGQPKKDPRGTFEVPFEESSLLHLEFSAPDLAPVLRAVEVHQGVDVDLGDVRMNAGRRVTGRVVDAETGAPIANARIQLVDTSQGAGDRSLVSSSVALTREDGTFELPQVEDKPFMLDVHDSDHLEGFVALGIGEASVTVRLERGARIEVTVRDHDGKPLNAQVALQPEDGSEWKGISVEDGTGAGSGLTPGLYRARVMSNESSSAKVFPTQQVQVPASGRVAVDFVERREGATLVLRMDDPQARGEAILLMGAEPPPISKETLPRWLSRGQVAAQNGSEKKFPYLPAGHAAVLLVRTSWPLQFHVEELEIPAEGVVERVVHPRWQPLPEK